MYPWRRNMKCPRCDGTMAVYTGSWFTDQDICLGCSKAEKEHPDYRYARQTVIEAERGGDMNFPGVGWPGKDGRLLR